MFLCNIFIGSFCSLKSLFIFLVGATSLRTGQFKIFSRLAALGAHFQRWPTTGWQGWRMPRSLESEPFKFSFWTEPFKLSFAPMAGKLEAKGKGWSLGVGVGQACSAASGWSHSRLEHRPSSILDCVHLFAHSFLLFWLWVFGSSLVFSLLLAGLCI